MLRTTASPMMAVLISLGALYGQSPGRERGLQDVTVAAAPQPVGPYYAVVIGNNDYQHVDKLQTAVNDAREVSKILRDRFGFQTQVLYNATRAQILKTIDSYRALPADSNLLFYYAGHGYRDKDANRAYWLPVDADRDERANWINSTDITDGIHAIKSRHILIISDSCFSGDLVMRDAKAAIPSGGHNAVVKKALSLNSRHIMSSGGDEPVADSGTGGHSVFAAALLESLNDIQEDVFRGNDLFDRVKRRVEMRSQDNQTPRYDILRDSFADLGDFVFFRSAKVATSSAAAMLTEAKKYLEAKQFDKTVPLLRSAAQGGNAEAASYLGYMYRAGLGGLAQDDVQAVSWFRKAADAGDTDGMNGLGGMYAAGRGGLPKDEAQAVSWYRKAVDAGDTNGMRFLGEMYQEGRGGLAKDPVQAAAWYRKAADAGNTEAMVALAVMYRSGPLPKNDSLCVSWYRKAADAGNSGAMLFLGSLYRFGECGLPKDDGQWVNWNRKAAEAGDLIAILNLGYMYEHGENGLPKDNIQALGWYRKAAALGSPDAEKAIQRLEH